MNKIKLLAASLTLGVSALFADAASDTAQLINPLVKRENPVQAHPFKERETVILNINIRDLLESARRYDLEKGSEFEMAFGSLFRTNAADLPTADFETTHETESRARQSQESTVQIELPASVLDILPNGDLVLQASRTVTAGENSTTVKVGGVASPQNISTTKNAGRVIHVVSSTYIKELKLDVSGKGPTEDNEKDGWISKVIRKIFKPF